MWSGASGKRARQSVRQALSQLRRVLGPQLLAKDDPVELADGVLESDVAAFFARLSENDVEAALVLRRGPLLEGLEIADEPIWARWLEDKAAALDQTLLVALHASIRKAEEEGHPDRVVELAAPARAIDPTSIDLRLKLIRSLLELDRRDGAKAEIASAYQVTGLSEEHRSQLTRLSGRAAQALPASADPRSDRRRDLHIPLVGREQEFRVLMRAWALARRERRQHVHVVGPSGVGKTRLALEVAKRIPEAEGTFVRISAHRAEQEHDLSVLSDLVQTLLGLPGSGGVTAATEATLRSLLPEASNGETRVASPALWEPRLLGDALQDLLDALAYETPLLVLLDDVQWADRASLDVIGRALRRLRQSAVFVITTSRDATDHTLAPLGDPDRVVRLLSLDRSGTVEILDELCGPGSFAGKERVASRLFEVTGGNPLFATQLLRALKEEGIVRTGGAWWSLDADRFLEEVPPDLSISDVIAERLAQLSPSARAVSTQIAHSGRQMDLVALAQRTGLGRETVLEAVSELVRREVASIGDHDRIRLSHDEVRRVIAQSASGAGSEEVGRKRTRMVAAALALIVAGLITVVGARGWTSRVEAEYPYGQGHLVVHHGDTVAAFQAPQHLGEVWQRASFPLPPGPAFAAWVRGPFRTLSGTVEFLAADANPLDPPTPVIWRDGTWVPFFQHDGDANVVDLSPDGRRALVVAEDLSTPAYDIDLLEVDIASGESRRLIASGGSRVGGLWSPDGSRILAVKSGRPDSLIVTSGDGQRLRVVETEFRLRVCHRLQPTILVYRLAPGIGRQPGT